MIKILHTIPSLDGGGADRILYDYCIRMAKEIKMDFIVHSVDEGILESKLRAYGCDIYHVSSFHDNMYEYVKKVRYILMHGEYDVIHVSQGYWGVIFLILAKKLGIRVRIAHSHMAFIPQTLIQKSVRGILTWMTKYVATDLFACGRDAARWMWGNSYLKENKVRIMRNGIDTSKYIYSVSKRNELREKYDVVDKLVLGNVARFAYQKNHKFLIDILSEIVKMEKEVVLFLIGRGELEEKVKQYVEQLGLMQYVRFMGVRDDVNDLLNMLDVFVLPSRFEGLPVTLVETQINGLPIVASSTITREVKFAENYAVLPLELSAKLWADKIISLRNKRIDVASEKIEENDINILASMQKKWYFDRCGSYER